MELPAPTRTSRLAGLLTVRGRLLALALVGMLMTAIVAGVAVDGQNEVLRATVRLQTYNKVQLANRDTEVRRGVLRNALFTSLLEDGGQLLPASVSDVSVEVQTATSQLVDDVDQVGQLTTGTSLAQPAAALRTEQEAYSREVLALLEQGQGGVRIPADTLVAQNVRYDALVADQQAFTARVDALRAVALTGRQHSQQQTRRYLIVGTALAALVLLVLSLLTRRWILHTLRELSGVAMAVASGDLAARCRRSGTDEIAELGQAIDTMAANLTRMVDQLEDDARRDGFGRELADAFDMADDEPAAYDVVQRALVDIVPAAPAELLLADSSEAHLQPVLSAPGAEAPGCPVESPFQCVAVRRGRSAVFADGDAIDACPKLRDRPQGAVSATCTPVTFMGRALGVLHATGPVGRAPAPLEVERLAALAGQAGARIGTLRATRTTELRASTDGLTGLINRRTLEDQVRVLVAKGRAFAIVMADLDNFKQLNDRFGHETGDRALRLFAQTLQANTRAQDLLCRYGGEEFVLVLPDQTRTQAREQLERLRVALSGAMATGTCPAFTASFGVTDTADSHDLKALLHSADSALFAAKRAGRDRVVLAGQSDEEVLESLAAGPP